MARKFSFNTFRLVALRDDDDMDNDKFTCDFIVDGEPLRNLPKDKKSEAAEFLVEFYQTLTKQSMLAYEKHRIKQAFGSADV